MKWSWKIARFAGIDVFVHSTFFILVAWVGYIYWKNQGTLAATIEGMVFIIALFTCVVLHEFGHALTARKFNIVTQKITLLPIGGIASMEKMPEKPQQEILVALAGPAVNIVIAALIWMWLMVSNTLPSLAEITTGGGSFLFQLLIVNVFLACFNLLPAFPMDGGRVLRATLAIYMEHHKATEKAALIGKSFAIVFGILGIFYNPFLILIAIFLWIGGEAENQAEQMKNNLGKSTAADAMLTEFHILSPQDSLSKAIELTLAGSQKEFPIGTKQNLIGVLTQNDLLAALQIHGEHIQVGKVEIHTIKTVPYLTPIQTLIGEIQINQAHTLAVSKNNSIVGIINLENIIELIKIHKALNKKS
jgi:Zn-dependent protease